MKYSGVQMAVRHKKMPSPGKTKVQNLDPNVVCLALNLEFCHLMLHGMRYNNWRTSAHFVGRWDM